MTENEKSDLIATAHALADAARSVTLSHFRRQGLDIQNKYAVGFDPVTEGDRAAEQAMRAILADQRPRDGILGEEFGPKDSASGLTWVLDPIDGTRSFMSGAPTWGVLIALSDQAGPKLGVIDQPYIGERFTGGLGRADLVGPHGQSALATRATSDLADAVLFTTFPEVGSQAERDAFQQVSSQVKLTRYGLDCYAYALIALGQIDLVIEAGLYPYDIQAPIAGTNNEASGKIKELS